MSRWTIGVHGLPTAEAGLVRALLTLVGSGDPRWRWTFAGAGPCDVLLADAASPAPQQAQSERQARALLLLGGTAADPQRHLQRPLRPNEFEAALRRLADAFSDPAVPAAGVSAHAEAPSLGNCRYKLLRWPPAAVLRGDPGRLRMATQLTRRFLSQAELVTLTGQESGRCLVFLQVLQGFQLLQLEPIAPAAPAATDRRPVPTPGGWALVRSIRRRLGL